MDLVTVASFDIGKKNFAFCIEEFDRTLLESIPTPTSKYKIDGTPTLPMQQSLKKVFQNGKIILHKNIDLTYNCDEKKMLDPETFHNMIDELNKYKSYWDNCLCFIIEEQMSFGKKLNKMAMKLGQHCYSYFTFYYGRTKQVIEFHAYHKTQVLGAPKSQGKPYKSGKIRYKAMEKTDRKKWTVEKAIQILSDRGEQEVLKNLTNKKKKDDLADTLCQLQAAKYRIFVEKII